MARNTGRGSRSSHIKNVSGDGDWLDDGASNWVVWSEEDGVVIYNGEKETATRRTVLTADEADELASLLQMAARDVRRLDASRE